MDRKNVFLGLVLLICLIGTVYLVAEPFIPTDQPEPVPSVTQQTLAITEICTKNESIIADNSEKYRDYIELYNSGSSLNLAGYILTDGKERSDPLPSIELSEGEYRVFFLSSELTGFALSASGGDYIQLLDPTDTVVAQATTTSLKEDQVMILQDGEYLVSSEPSPGFPNDAQGISAFMNGIPDTDPDLVISELLIGNTSALPDENGNFPDILELYNASDSPIALEKYFLSDSTANRYRYRFPEQQLAPGSYLLVYCDSQDYIGPDGELHVNFSLSHGEEICLTDNTGHYQALPANYEGDDVSCSRSASGDFETGSVSLGFENTAEGCHQFYLSRINTDSALLISEVLLSSEDIPYQGTICDVIEITNTTNKPLSTANWYLSDGGDPYRYRLPEQELAPGACTVITCGPTTTGFSLSEGEILYLLGPDLLMAPPVSCNSNQSGQSITLLDMEGEPVYGFSEVTLGYPNTPENHLNFLTDAKPDGLMISELMSSNNSYLKGAYATVCDWIELYNASDVPIQLSDYHITNNAGRLQRYALPDETLAPGQYRVILLAEEKKNLRSGYPVLPFALSADGEQLYLSKNDVIVDYVFLPALATDASYGRADGDSFFSLLASVTPQKKNSAAAMITATPTVVTPQGVYDGVEYVDVVLSGEGDIFYTTDCTAPTTRSKRYTEPIRITKTTVLRVMCRAEGKQRSEILDLTYLVNENDTLDVVCLVTNPSGLWDPETGIYVKGPNADPVFPFLGANYWMDWECTASVSLFADNEDGFYSPCGIKIFGAYSRTQSKKSLVCYFRGEYGNRQLEYPLFGEEGLDTYEAFVLRVSGQDAFNARMRDTMITSLVASKTSIPVQKYRPVVVYINGEYFGLHYIREKLNEHYIAGNFNVEPDEVTMTEWSGRYCKPYWDLATYARTHDMTQQEHYDYVCSQIDVDEYIDYIIAQMWIANTDAENVRYFIAGDVKWTWILYDTDLSFQNPKWNSVSYCLDASALGAKDHISRTLVVRLLKNPEFRDKFIRRTAWQLENIWREETLIAQIDMFENMIATDMVKDCERWNRSYSEWQRNVNALRSFAKKRNEYFLDYFSSHFNLSDAQMREYGFPV